MHKCVAAALSIAIAIGPAAAQTGVGVQAGGAGSSASVGVGRTGTSIGAGASIGGSGGAAAASVGTSNTSIGASVGASGGGASGGLSAGGGGVASSATGAAGASPAAASRSTGRPRRPAVPRLTAVRQSITLPPTLLPSGGSDRASAATAFGWIPGTPAAVVRACRDAVGSAAAPFGVVSVRARSAGSLRRLSRGAISAPVQVRIHYARQGGPEIRAGAD